MHHDRHVARRRPHEWAAMHGLPHSVLGFLTLGGHLDQPQIDPAELLHEVGLGGHHHPDVLLGMRHLVDACTENPHAAPGEEFADLRPAVGLPGLRAAHPSPRAVACRMERRGAPRPRTMKPGPLASSRSLRQPERTGRRVCDFGCIAKMRTLSGPTQQPRTPWIASCLLVVPGLPGSAPSWTFRAAGPCP